MNTIDTINTYFANTNKTLVFSSATVAKSYILSYAKENRGKAIFYNRAITWNDLTDLLIDKNNRKKAEIGDRIIFVASFFNSEKWKDLKYFASTEYSESIASYETYITSILPYLPRDTSPFNIPKEEKTDITLLREAYSEYLKENNLFEKEFENYDLSRINTDDYILVFPSSFADGRIKEIVDKFETIDNIFSSPLPLNEYSSSIAEIRGTIRKIERLRETVSLSDITITLLNRDDYLPYLVTEATKRDIPLSNMTPISFENTKCGRFFFALKKIVDENFSLSSVKVLFLDPSFPFKNSDVLQTIIDLAIEAKITDGDRNLWLEKLSALLSSSRIQMKYPKAEEAVALFSSISQDIENIVLSEDVSSLYSSLVFFKNDYFKQSPFTNEYEKALSFLSPYLTKIKNGKNIYLTFLTLLQSCGSKENNPNPGIKVYSYPETAGLRTPYHFVLGLTDSSSSFCRDKRTYLSDSDRGDKDEIRDNLLLLYMNPIFSKETTLSGTTLTPSGAELLPTLFLDNKVVIKEIEKDSYSEEKSLYMREKLCNIPPTLYQKRSFKNGKNALNYKEEAVTEVDQKERKEDINVTVFNLYDKCAYRGFAADRLKGNEKETESNFFDPRVLGNILHNTIENSLKESGKIINITEDIIKKNLKESVIKEWDKNSISSPLVAYYWYYKYEEKLMDFVLCSRSALFSETSLFGNELSLTSFEVFSGVTLKGRLDTLLIEGENEYKILDYKTSGDSDYNSSEIDGVSLQIYLYKKMIENPNCNIFSKEERHVSAASFYSINKGDYFIVWPPFKAKGAKKEKGYNEEDIEENGENRIEEIKGYFITETYNPDDKKCDFCPYFSLCRKGFIAK